MRIAVLGVGLIGGSIGLAAKRRLGAEVVGYDAEPANARRGVEVGALDRVGGSIAEALEGAEVVFCAGPVGALPALVAEALDASSPDAVVTDVGSTKRELIAGLPEDERLGRFIGGHPLAGAETRGGRERARRPVRGRPLVPDADRALERRPLRPPPAGRRRPRRPSAGDRRRDPRPADGDGQPPPARDRQRARPAGRRGGGRRSPSACPRSARAFATRPRVAGANPAIWGDIFATNSARRSPARSTAPPSAFARPRS